MKLNLVQQQLDFTRCVRTRKTRQIKQKKIMNSRSRLKNAHLLQTLNQKNKIEIQLQLKRQKGSLKLSKSRWRDFKKQKKKKNAKKAFLSEEFQNQRIQLP